MTVLLVLKDEREIPALTQTLTKLLPEAELLCFAGPLPALAEARKTEIDIALLDVDLPELDGIDLGQYLQELYPFVNLIYLSDGPERAFEALSQHASGYLLKPAAAESVRREMDDLRHPASEKKQKRLFAQTFGNFEIFVDGKPVMFKYTRTKEIVALLINNRGAQTTNGEIIATLWEDDGDPEKKASYSARICRTPFPASSSTGSSSSSAEVWRSRPTGSNAISSTGWRKSRRPATIISANT